MLLYFYHYEFTKGEITEKAVEVIETAKTYRSATEESLPWLYKTRMSKEELRVTFGGGFGFTYISDIQDMGAVRKIFMDICEEKRKHAAADAEMWKERLNSIQE